MTASTPLSLPIPVSFEFYPPNTDAGGEKLKTVVQELGVTQPEFFSVTYGAGGSTRDRTLSTVLDIAALGFEAAPHLSCIGSTRRGIDDSSTPTTSTRSAASSRCAATCPAAPPTPASSATPAS